MFVNVVVILLCLHTKFIPKFKKVVQITFKQQDLKILLQPFALKHCMLSVVHIVP